MALPGISTPNFSNVLHGFGPRPTVPTPRSTSILGRILAGHPSWRGPAGPNNNLNPGTNPRQFVAPIGIATPGAYGTTPPPVPGATPPSQPPPGPDQGSGPVNPTLDSTALGNIAANDFKVNNQINALNQRGAYADTDLQRALASLTNQTNLQDRGAQERANSQGLLSSSTVANQLGQIGQSAGDRQASLNTNNARLHASINDQIAGLQGNVPIFDQEQAAGAAERAAAADAANKALGMPIPAAPAPAPVGAPAPAPTARPPAPRPAARPPVRTKGGMFGKGLTSNEKSALSTYLLNLTKGQGNA